MTTTILLLGVILGSIFMFGFTAEDALGAVFAKYDGIDGESKDKDHDKWIDVLSVSWGAHQRGSLPGDDTPTRPGGGVIIDDLTITMEYEKSSAKLHQSCLQGDVIPKLEIETTASYGGARETYLKYELENVQITSCQVSGGDEDRPTMVVGNNFEKIKVTYTEYELVEKDSVEFEFDLNRNDNEPRVVPQSGQYNQYNLPEWFQTNLIWMQNGLISEDELFQSIKYLKQNGILEI